MFKGIVESPLFALAGVGIFAYGAIRFAHLVLRPHAINVINNLPINFGGDE